MPTKKNAAPTGQNRRGTGLVPKNMSDVFDNLYCRNLHLPVVENLGVAHNNMVQLTVLSISKK